MATLDKRWIKLGDLPKSLFHYTQATKVNEYEFVAVPGYTPESSASGMSKYNVHKNEWTKLMEYPKDITIEGITKNWKR